MSTTELSRDQTLRGASYDRTLRMGMAVACLLFPLLFMLAAIFFVLNPGEFVVEPDTEWIGGNDVERYGILWLAWYAGIAAMLGLVRLLKDTLPRLAFWATILVFVGGLTQISWGPMMLHQSALRRIPFEPYPTTLLVDQSPVYMWAITVLLWMIGLILLGIGIWRTGVLPKWTGILLIAGTIGFFLHQGPGGAIASTVPIIGILVAGVCFLLAFPIAGLRLWKG